MEELKVNNIISFFTQGDWSASDVANLSSSASDLYNVFLALDYSSKLNLLLMLPYKELIDRYSQRPDQHIFSEYLEVLKKYFEILIKVDMAATDKIPSPFYFPLLATRLSEDFKSVYDIYVNIDAYATNSQKLRVRRIQISSPGKFTFEGSGEIIKQLRELIKDFWYRNKNEKLMGELDIVDKCLKIRRENPDLRLPPFPKDILKLTEVIGSSIGKIEQLERDGKLLDVPKNLDKEKMDMNIN
jgi:hypothetical protein